MSSACFGAPNHRFGDNLAEDHATLLVLAQRVDVILLVRGGQQLA